MIRLTLVAYFQSVVLPIEKNIKNTSIPQSTGFSQVPIHMIEDTHIKEDIIEFMKKNICIINGCVLCVC